MNTEAIVTASQLVARLWNALDRRAYDELLSLLAPDCRWHRDGGWQKGHDAIAASLERRPPALFTRHLLSGLIVDAEADSQGQALACGYTLIVHATLLAAANNPRLAEAPIMLADATTRCVRVGADWRIAEIGAQVTFMRDVPKAAP